MAKWAKASGSLLQFLEKLPRDLRSRAALAYHSESTQFASAEYPRTILFADDASLLVAYSGNPDPKAKGTATAEAIAFDFDKCQFTFHSFEFPRTIPDVRVPRRIPSTRVDHSPKECAGCHEGLPIWDTYAMWPGFYGSYDDGIRADSVEGGYYEKFQRLSARKGLYKPLVGISGLRVEKLARYTREHSLKPNRAYYTTHIDTDLFAAPSGIYEVGKGLSRTPDYENGARPLLKLSSELMKLNTSRIAHELEEKKISKDVHLALLAALSDCTPMEDYLPESLLESAAIEVPRWEDELRRRASEYHAHKLARMKPYVWPMDGRERDFEDRPHSLRMRARVLHLLGSLGLDADHWALTRPRASMQFQSSNSALNLMVPYLGEAAIAYDAQLSPLGFKGDGIWSYSCHLLKSHFVVE